MGWPVGNRYWESRSSHGPNPKFASGEELAKACAGYFEWCHANPWIKIDYKGKDVEQVEIPTERPPSIVGLCVYLEISRSTWYEWKDNPDLSDIVKRVEEVIYAHKLEGATVGTYNSSIVARELGLVERHEHSGPDGQPIQTITRTIVDPKEGAK